MVAGAGLLVAGLVNGNDSYLIGTIAVSLVAATCLFISSRRSASRSRTRTRTRRAERVEVARQAEPVDSRLSGKSKSRAEWEREDGSFRDDESAVDDYDDSDVDLEFDTQAVPADEPPEADMSSVESAALMRMDTEVMVVDGRPRFHMTSCVHLVGRECEPLPAYEAVELGFGPCSLCRPVQALLREPSRS
ncbi:MAG: hypothetical protein ACRDXX_01820 [Stackebrandtia sp.]